MDALAPRSIPGSPSPSSSLSPRGPGLPGPEAPSSGLQPDTKLGGSCRSPGPSGPLPWECDGRQGPACLRTPGGAFLGGRPRTSQLNQGELTFPYITCTGSQSKPGESQGHGWGTENHGAIKGHSGAMSANALALTPRQDQTPGFPATNFSRRCRGTLCDQQVQEHLHGSQ